MRLEIQNSNSDTFILKNQKLGCKFRFPVPISVALVCSKKPKLHGF